MLDQRILRIIFNKATGSARGTNTLNAKLSIPSSWLKRMELTPDNREVIVTFEDNTITIKKK